MPLLENKMDNFFIKGVLDVMLKLCLYMYISQLYIFVEIPYYLQKCCKSTFISKVDSFLYLLFCLYYC